MLLWSFSCSTCCRHQALISFETNPTTMLRMGPIQLWFCSNFWSFDHACSVGQDHSSILFGVHTRCLFQSRFCYAFQSVNTLHMVAVGLPLGPPSNSWCLGKGCTCWGWSFHIGVSTQKICCTGVVALILFGSSLQVSAGQRFAAAFVVQLVSPQPW